MNLSPKFSDAARTLAIAAAFAASAIAPALAQLPPTSNQLAPADRAFVTTMLQESRGQLRLARLAEKRASNPETASAAKQTIAEWSALRGRLVPLAYAVGAPVRGTLDAAQTDMLWKLGRTQPAQFGREYLRDAQHGNANALTRIELERTTTSARLRQFVSFAQPLVSSYEQMTSDDVGAGTAHS